MKLSDAAKYYYTENYFFEIAYSDPTNNIGYMRLPNSNNPNGYGVYEFYISNNEVVVDKDKMFEEKEKKS